jgi:hypothetical protein
LIVTLTRGSSFFADLTWTLGRELRGGKLLDREAAEDGGDPVMEDWTFVIFLDAVGRSVM